MVQGPTNHRAALDSAAALVCNLVGRWRGAREPNRSASLDLKCRELVVVVKAPPTVLAFCVMLLFCGCFQATNKFYLDSDVTTDALLEGNFQLSKLNPDEQRPAPSLSIKLVQNRHYLATYQEADQWIKLDVVLFKLGTNTFVDISQLSNNVVPPNPHRPNPEPSGLELISKCTKDGTHTAFRVQLADNEVKSQFLTGVAFVRATRSDPALKFKDIEDHSAVFESSTQANRAFLANVNYSADPFPQIANWRRVTK